MSLFKQKACMAAIAAVVAGAATGAPVVFDPNGGAGPPSAQAIKSFDWNTTSFLALNGQAAIANFLAAQAQQQTCSTACQFDILTSATLSAINLPDNSIWAGTGLGSTFEITLVARFTEQVTNVGTDLNGNPGAAFKTVTTAPGFLEVYYDTAVNSNALTGFGYNDGRLILSGTSIGAATGSFSVDNSQPIQALDQSGIDNYPGQQTVVGGGTNQNIAVSSLAWDPTFFLNGLTDFGISFANISLALPYISIDPSDCFTGAASGTAVGSTRVSPAPCANTHVLGTFAANSPDANGGIVPNTGPVNGLFASTSRGPDFVAQTDFNSPLNGNIPEPGTLALVGLALAGLGSSLRKKVGR